MQERIGVFVEHGLRALDLPGTQAAGANIHGFGRAVHNRLHPTDVGLPGSVGLAVGVGDGVTEHHAFAANITLCHLKHLLKHSRPKRRQSYIK